MLELGRVTHYCVYIRASRDYDRTRIIVLQFWRIAMVHNTNEANIEERKRGGEKRKDKRKEASETLLFMIAVRAASCR